MSSVYIIAEAGVNHNGDRKIAFQLVDEAAKAGVDAVKFQTFKAASLVTKEAIKADYQKQATQSVETQYTMLKRLELSRDLHHALVKRCQQHGIEFLSTAFDQKSLDFLVNDLGVKTLKIPSGEITNGPLLLSHAVIGCDMILSTGMATLGEIEEALGVLAFGLLYQGSSRVRPSKEAFQKAYLSVEGQALLKQKVTLLHCTTEYPAPMEEINLNAMAAMQNSYGLLVGYSDHSEGIFVPIAAVALGAKIIEKHLEVAPSV